MLNETLHTAFHAYPKVMTTLAPPSIHRLAFDHAPNYTYPHCPIQGGDLSGLPLTPLPMLREDIHHSHLISQSVNYVKLKWLKCQIPTSDLQIGILHVVERSKQSVMACPNRRYRRVRTAHLMARHAFSIMLYLLACTTSLQLKNKGEREIRRIQEWSTTECSFYLQTSVNWDGKRWSPQGSGVNCAAYFRFNSGPSSSVSGTTVTKVKGTISLHGLRRLRWHIFCASPLSIRFTS